MYPPDTPSMFFSFTLSLLFLFSYHPPLPFTLALAARLDDNRPYGIVSQYFSIHHWTFIPSFWTSFYTVLFLFIATPRSNASRDFCQLHLVGWTLVVAWLIPFRPHRYPRTAIVKAFSVPESLNSSENIPLTTISTPPNFCITTCLPCCIVCPRRLLHSVVSWNRSLNRCQMRQSQQFISTIDANYQFLSKLILSAVNLKFLNTITELTQQNRHFSLRK